ncbi:hypothetical protein BY458DRAFT_515715 [Sporodiniella umbellata]|nr:hypothetical protein BY458DRAFT_515715 [Sporodiniella umbellata]
MSYISALNLLEDPSSNNISEEALRDELALWTNAQFTYDIQPGSGSKPVMNDLYTPITSIVSEPTKEPTRKRSKTIEVDEDKRKRNTAASARFRQKKKQKEQELDQKTKEMESKTKYLEERLIELEREAAWLRALVLEKRK